MALIQFWEIRQIRVSVGEKFVNFDSETMPPRSVKRGGGAVATRRTGRAARGAQKAQNQPLPSEEPIQAEAVEAKEEVKVETKPVVEEKPLITQENPPAVDEKIVLVNQHVSEPKSESKLEPNGLRSKFLVV